MISRSAWAPPNSAAVSENPELTTVVSCVSVERQLKRALLHSAIIYRVNSRIRIRDLQLAGYSIPAISGDNASEKIQPAQSAGRTDILLFQRANRKTNSTTSRHLTAIRAKGDDDRRWAPMMPGCAIARQMWEWQFQRDQTN